MSLGRHELELGLQYLIGQSPREGDLIYRETERWNFRNLEEIIATALGEELDAYTPDAETVVYDGLDNTAIGPSFANVADLNALRVAYENLRAAYENLRSSLVSQGIVSEP